MSALVADDETVAAYNPLRHEVIDRARLRHLGSLLDSCAFRLSQALSGSLRRPTRLSPGQFEQATWDEYRSEMGESAVIMTVPVAGIEERILLHIPTSTALLLYEVQMGADGPSRLERDALTDLEFAMIGNLAAGLCKALKNALEAFVDVGATPQRHRSPHSLRMGKPGDACFRVHLSIVIGEGQSKPLWLYFQIATIRSMLETVEEQEENPEEGQAVTLDASMQEVPLSVVCAYPAARVRAIDVLTWGEGTTVSLGCPESEKSRVDILVDRVRIGRGFWQTNGLRARCTIEEWERS